jgi:hypothetical protein
MRSFSLFMLAGSRPAGILQFLRVRPRTVPPDRELLRLAVPQRVPRDSGEARDDAIDEKDPSNSSGKITHGACLSRWITFMLLYVDCNKSCEIKLSVLFFPKIFRQDSIR